MNKILTIYEPLKLLKKDNLNKLNMHSLLAEHQHIIKSFYHTLTFEIATQETNNNNMSVMRQAITTQRQFVVQP